MELVHEETSPPASFEGTPTSVFGETMVCRVSAAGIGGTYSLFEVEAQTHRRFLKTHLPLDTLVLSPQAKYIYIGRDGRDIVWSMYYHHANANGLCYEALNDTPGRVGPL